MSEFLKVAQMIQSERVKQVNKGYDSAHDDAHTDGELASAAIAHLVEAGASMTAGDGGADYWPWDDEKDFNSLSQLDNLVAAGALIQAEIARVLRTQQK